MEHTLRDGGLVWRTLGAWTDLRGAMRAELDRNPTEGRLLFYAMLSQAIWLVGRLMELSHGPLAPTLSADDFAFQASSNIASVFFTTLLLYGIAVLVHAFARALGGRGSLRDSRAALFWASLVAAPVVLALHLVALVAFRAPGEPGRVAGTLGGLILGYVLARTIAEAHGFKGFWRGFAVVAGIALFALALVAGAAALVAP